MSGFVPPTKRGGPSVKTPVPASLPSKKKSAAAERLEGQRRGGDVADVPAHGEALRAGDVGRRLGDQRDVGHAVDRSAARTGRRRARCPVTAPWPPSAYVLARRPAPRRPSKPNTCPATAAGGAGRRAGGKARKKPASPERARRREEHARPRRPLRTACSCPRSPTWTVSGSATMDTTGAADAGRRARARRGRAASAGARRSSRGIGATLSERRPGVGPPRHRDPAAGAPAPHRRPGDACAPPSRAVDGDAILPRAAAAAATVKR